MPITLPPFEQYRGPLVILPGLWNKRPVEGDKTVNAEITWTGAADSSAVQFQLSGNSPVALSQIAALYIDNSRCFSDITFVFPDTGFSITVPPEEQLLIPVITNALMFYAVGTGTSSSDVTVLQILNSVPPPIAPVTIPSPVPQSTESIHSIDLTSVHSTPIIAGGINGVIKGFSIVGWIDSGGVGLVGVRVALVDGGANTLWSGEYEVNVSPTPVNIGTSLSGLNLSFINGLDFAVLVTGLAGGTASVNIYYEVA